MTSSVPAVMPFRGLRYSPQRVGDLAGVVAPPYDVISPELQGRLYERSPHNIVRLILARRTAEDSAHYAAIAGELRDWIRSGVLVRDPEPSFYLYEETFSLPDGSRPTRKGFLGLCRLEELGKGRVFPHEETLPGPKRDRLALLKACRTHLSPVFALYEDGDGAVRSALEPFDRAEPAVSLEDEEGVGHRMWRVTDPAVLEKVSRQMERKKLLLADGHHRYETALAYRRWRLEEEPGGLEQSSRYILMFFNAIEDPGLVVLPTHRLVHNRRLPAAAVLEEGLKRHFEIRPIAGDRRGAFLDEFHKANATGHALGLVANGGERLWLASWDPEKIKIPLSAVGSAVVREVILKRLLGLTSEEEKMPDILTFIKGDESLLESASAGKDSLGILVAPPSVREIRRVAESGLVLPPKTTYFYPKLLSGLVLNPLDSA